MVRRIDDAHNPGGAALVGDGRAALAVDRGQEEEVAAFDEGLLLGADLGLEGDLLDAVGHGARLEAVLQGAVLVLVKPAHESVFSLFGMVIGAHIRTCEGLARAARAFFTATAARVFSCGRSEDKNCRIG